MNRREFIKKCGFIPFIGGLATVGQAVASEGNVVDYRSLVRTDEEYAKFIGPLAQFNKALKDKEIPLKLFDDQAFEAPWPLCHKEYIE